MELRQRLADPLGGPVVQRHRQRRRGRNPCARPRGDRAGVGPDRAMFTTEHEFELPVGYLDSSGTLHRDGVMRLATAADEILPMKDPRVQALPTYLIVILLSRVVV